MEAVDTRPIPRATVAAPSADLPAPLADLPAPSADMPAIAADDEDAPGTPWLRSSASFLASMVFHLLLLVGLAMIVFPDNKAKTLLEEEEPLVIDMPSDAQDTQQPIAEEFYTEIQTTSSITSAITAAVPTVGDAGVASGRMISQPALDAKLLVADLQGASTAIDLPAVEIPDMPTIASGVPDGAAGDPRVIVRNYEQALDRITEEVLWMLAKRKVLLVWCFDQSESMKDDQAEIRGRIDSVYDELGLREETTDDALTSAVVSYGEGFWRNMRRGPSSDVEEIRQAIDSVQVDPSGKEFMCQAVLRAIELYSGYAKEQDRQMALILVTDESGERTDNLQYLEQAVAAAHKNNCRIYVLGREAVFGYPYAHMRWVHPQTRHEHWLPIDRGPETAFVEQLQTDGFHQRTDAHPSGFGPYEQTRLARETGGIFFMLPSLETDLVRGERGEYELTAMRQYRPDLRSRADLFAEVKANPLRVRMLTIIDDLNPQRPEVAELMGVRFKFSSSAKKFFEEVREEQTQAMRYLTYLDAAAKELDSMAPLRQQETSPRWQANYDLVFAQVLAYTARRYEYNSRLDRFVRELQANPGMIPLTKPGSMQLSGFNVTPSSETIGGEVTDKLIARSEAMFRELVEQHPGTPWAARAEKELQRGFGFAMSPQYRYAGPRPTTPRGPRPPRPKPPTIPIPKL
ncbi:MAG: vWA domain-containing protein [Pirellulaceae bacterium]